MSLEASKKMGQKRVTPPATTKVIQTKPIEKRGEVRKVVRERYRVVLKSCDPEEKDDSQQLHLEGFVTDLSSKGIGLVLNGKVPKGTNVALHITASHGEGDILAKVAWSRLLPSSSHIIKPEEEDHAQAWRVGLELIVQTAESDAADFYAKLLKSVGAE